MIASELSQIASSATGQTIGLMVLCALVAFIVVRPSLHFQISRPQTKPPKPLSRRRALSRQPGRTRRTVSPAWSHPALNPARWRLPKLRRRSAERITEPGRLSPDVQFAMLEEIVAKPLNHAQAAMSLQRRAEREIDAADYLLSTLMSQFKLAEPVQAPATGTKPQTGAIQPSLAA